MTIKPGDVVRKHDTVREMLVIGIADQDPNEVAATPEVSCAWGQERVLHEECVGCDKLTVVRRERRRIPRVGALKIPGH